MIIDTDEGIYTVALGLLYILKDKEPYRNVSRLAFTLDRKAFDSLIDTMGGMTITIPNREEVNSMLKALIYYQVRYVENKSFQEACRVSGASLFEAQRVKKYAKEIKRFIDNINEQALQEKSLDKKLTLM